jgi:CheY-like chemotaxis protein
VPVDLAGRGRGEAAQHAQHGGFAGARGAEQGENLAGHDGEIGGGDHLNAVLAGLRVVLLDLSARMIVVVDDERIIADSLAMILNQSGFEARAVYSGEKAVEQASAFEPQMLITDVIMADLNGIDAAIQIRAILPQVKVLLFSGQAATADLLEKARAQGYEFEILAKPVHPQDLLSRLRA